MIKNHTKLVSVNFNYILGIRFYTGGVDNLIQLIKTGGLIVAPAAPALATMKDDLSYRIALENSDWAIVDSGFLVILWLIFNFEYIPKLSGLKFLRALLRNTDFCKKDNSFWIMPSNNDLVININWLNKNGVC